MRRRRSTHRNANVTLQRLLQLPHSKDALNVLRDALEAAECPRLREPERELRERHAAIALQVVQARSCRRGAIVERESHHHLSSAMLIHCCSRAARAHLVEDSCVAAAAECARYFSASR